MPNNCKKTPLYPTTARTIPLTPPALLLPWTQPGATLQHKLSPDNWLYFDSYLSEYAKIMATFLAAFLLCTLLFFISYLLSFSRQKESEKASEYECGFEPFDNATRQPFDVHFYIVGILFLIFDVEIALLFPWSAGLENVGVTGFWNMILFLIILTIGFVYEWKRGALSWSDYEVHKTNLDFIKNTTRFNKKVSTPRANGKKKKKSHLQRFKKNLTLAIVLPFANVTLLHVWAPSMHNLVDFIFIIWDFLIYIGAGAMIVGLASGVIFSQNPIRSLFCLIGVFMSAIFLLLSMRVEFLSMIFLIVYIGAIAILFLFVIMLLNLKKAMPSYDRTIWWRLGHIVFFFLVSAKAYVFLSSAIYVNSYYNARTLSETFNSGLIQLNQSEYFLRFGLTDTSLFSELFYNAHGFNFLTTSYLLLVSMIGSIVLALSNVAIPKTNPSSSEHGA